jgi:hypothetical protein
MSSAAAARVSVLRAENGAAAIGPLACAGPEDACGDGNYLRGFKN